MEKYDVIVVGAGISGMSAARSLNQGGLKVLVLEATHRVGGKLETVIPEDYGPQYGWAALDSGYNSDGEIHFQRVLMELGFETYYGSFDLDAVHYSSQGRYLHGDLMPNLWRKNPFAAWDMHCIVRRLEKMCWEVPPDRPWDAPNAKQWDQITMEEFYKKHCWTSFAYEYFVKTSGIDTASVPSKMSLLFYLWYMRTNNGPLSVWDLTEGADAKKIVGGSSQLVDKMARELNGSLITNQAVTNISQGANEVKVITKNGDMFRAKYLILATPLQTHKNIQFSPPLSPMRSHLIEKSSTGEIMMCILLFKDPFWVNKGYCGFATCSDPNEPIRVIFEDHRQGYDFFSLSCCVYNPFVTKFCSMNDEEKKRRICQSVCNIFGIEGELKPDHFLWKCSSEDPYVCGGYASFFEPEVLTKYGPAIRAPLGPRVFLAGSEAATHHYGFMSGAIDSGQRAAREVLHADGRLKNSEVHIQEKPERETLSLFDQMLPSIEAALIFFFIGIPIIIAVIALW